uniref:Mitochondrial inner membrane protease subunit 2 n=1 Tax=Hippophae rhamnoides TaxID=193516 RepID=A0AAU7LJP3_9ROSA
MVTGNILWNYTKKVFTFGLIGVTVSDTYASISAVRGSSMSPTLNPHTSSSMRFTVDYVLVDKTCLLNYKFSRGDVVVYSSPSSYKEKHIKRIIALPGDWIGIRNSSDVMRVPEGHCWVEGDNQASSMDSNAYGPIPLGLIKGRVTRIVWPPQRISPVERRIPADRISAYRVDFS